MTKELAPQHDRATHSDTTEPKMSLLVQGLFGVMSGDYNISRLAGVLDSRKTPELKSLDDQSLLAGAKVSFTDYEGAEDLGLTIKHNEETNQLIVGVKTPPVLRGGSERSDIASHILGALKNATNNEIEFRGLKETIGHATSSTDSRGISYEGRFKVPDGLDQRLFAQAQAVFKRDAEAQIVVDKVFRDLFKTQPQTGPKSQL